MRFFQQEFWSGLAFSPPGNLPNPMIKLTYPVSPTSAVKFLTSIKAMVFPIVMYGCESWTVKKADHRRIDAFELWCWRRLLRVPWTARRFNQSILKEINPRIYLEGMMLKLKRQYFGHLIRRAESLEKTLMVVGIGGRRRRGRLRMRWLDGQGDLVCCNSWGPK